MGVTKLWPKAGPEQTVVAQVGAGPPQALSQVSRLLMIQYLHNKRFLKSICCVNLSQLASVVCNQRTPSAAGEKALSEVKLGARDAEVSGPCRSLKCRIGSFTEFLNIKQKPKEKTCLVK